MPDPIGNGSEQISESWGLVQPESTPEEQKLHVIDISRLEYLFNNAEKLHENLAEIESYVNLIPLDIKIGELGYTFFHLLLANLKIIDLLEGLSDPKLSALEIETICIQYQIIERIIDNVIKKATELNLLNLKTELHETALHLAAAKGNLQNVKKLIEAGADINAKTKASKEGEQPETFFTFASHRIDENTLIKLIQLLLKQCVSKQNYNNKYNLIKMLMSLPLDTPLRFIDRTYLHFLLAKLQIIDLTDDTVVPLDEAEKEKLSNQNETVVKIIDVVISKAKELNLLDVRTSLNETPLHLVAYEGNILAIIKLIEAGADINVKAKTRTNDKRETTFLPIAAAYPACQRKLTLLINIMLKKGYNVREYLKNQNFPEVLRSSKVEEKIINIRFDFINQGSFFYFTSDQEILFTRVEKKYGANKYWHSIWVQKKLSALVDIYAGLHPEIMSKNEELYDKYSRELREYCEVHGVLFPEPYKIPASAIQIVSAKVSSHRSTVFHGSKNHHVVKEDKEKNKDTAPHVGPANH